MKLLTLLRWKLRERHLEKALTDYCSYEFRPADRGWALEKTLEEHKRRFLGE